MSEKKVEPRNRVKTFCALTKGADESYTSEHINAGFQVIAWLSENTGKKQSDFIAKVETIRKPSAAVVSRNRTMALASLRYPGLKDWTVSIAARLAAAIVGVKEPFTISVVAESEGLKAADIIEQLDKIK